MQKHQTLDYKNYVKNTTTHLSETSLPTLLGNGAQIRILSSTRRLGTGGSFPSSSVQHSGSHSTKTATKGTKGEGSRG